jgi:hypothetical protein
MKAHSVFGAIAIFVLGGLVGHVVTLPSAAGSAANVAQISPLELTMQAGHLPVQTADAI